MEIAGVVNTVPTDVLTPSLLSQLCNQIHVHSNITTELAIEGSITQTY